MFNGACQEATFFFSGVNVYGIGKCTSASAYSLQLYGFPNCAGPALPHDFNAPGVCGTDPTGSGSSGEITCVSAASGGAGGAAGINMSFVYLAVGVGAALILLTVACCCCCQRTKPAGRLAAQLDAGDGYYAVPQPQYAVPQQQRQLEFRQNYAPPQGSVQ